MASCNFSSSVYQHIMFGKGYIGGTSCIPNFKAQIVKEREFGSIVLQRWCPEVVFLLPYERRKLTMERICVNMCNT